MNPPSIAPRRIALFRLSALGDVVLATALVATLRRAFPEAEITWITSRASHGILAGLEKEPGATLKFRVVDKIKSPGDWLRFRREMAAEKFDVLLAAQASMRANLMFGAIPATRKIGFDRRRAKDLHHWFVGETIACRDEHLAEGFLGFARALGVPEADWVRKTTVPIDDAARAQAATLLAVLGGKPFLAINAAASKPERTWRAERYVELAERARRELGWGIVFTGGPAAVEKNLAAEIQRALSPTDPVVLDLVGKTTPKQLAAVLVRAAALLAPDTGPVHIARAVGTPIVGLYAVARSALTGPFGAGEWCVDVYPEAVRQLLGRDPASVGWHTRVHAAGAMDLISVDAVWANLRALSSATRPPAPAKHL